MCLVGLSACAPKANNNASGDPAASSAPPSDSTSATKATATLQAPPKPVVPAVVTPASAVTPVAPTPSVTPAPTPAVAPVKANVQAAVAPALPVLTPPPADVAATPPPETEDPAADQPVQVDRHGCETRLTSPDEIKLLQDSQKLHLGLIGETITPAEYEAKLAALLKEHRATPDAPLISTISAEMEKANYKQKLFMKRLAGLPLTDDQTHMAEMLSITLSEDDVNLGRPYFETLQKIGVRIDENGNWDLSQMKLVLSQNQDPWKNAFMVLVSPVFAGRLADVHRNEALVLGNWLILPQSQRPTMVNAPLRTITVADYKVRVQDIVNKFNQEIERFLQASRESSTMSNLMEGGSWWSTTRGLNGQTAPEITLEGESQAMIQWVRMGVETYGIPRKLRNSMMDAIQKAGNINQDNLKAGLVSLKVAGVAVLAAPLIPLSLYLAPAAIVLAQGSYAAALDLALYGVDTTGVLSAPIGLQSLIAGIATTPLILGMGSTLIQASMDAVYNDKPIWCTLPDDMLRASTKGLYTGSLLSVVPLAAPAMGYGAELTLLNSRVLTWPAYHPLSLSALPAAARLLLLK